MNDKFLTILTPTYNRGYKINDLYESLCKQCNKRFIWLIVDDGSTDNTEIIVNKWKQDAIIDIEYYKQKNSGKQSAEQLGISKLTTPLCMSIDSDDIISDNAIDIINGYWKKDKLLLSNNTCNFIGYISSKRDSLYNVKDRFPLNYNSEYINFFELKDVYKYRGESAWVCTKESLQNTVIPIFENEKFLIDDVVNFLLSHTKNLKIISEKIYEYEYLDDGLTKKEGVNILYKSPHSLALYNLIYAQLTKSYLKKFKFYSRYLGLIRAFNLDVGQLSFWDDKYNLPKIPKLISLLARLYSVHYKRKYYKLR